VINEESRQRRRAAYEDAKISVRLEGFLLPKEVEDIHAKYINGFITSEERISELNELYKHEYAYTV
jgi:hypothetical protein